MLKHALTVTPLSNAQTDPGEVAIVYYYYKLNKFSGHNVYNLDSGLLHLAYSQNMCRQHPDGLETQARIPVTFFTLNSVQGLG